MKRSVVVIASVFVGTWITLSLIAGWFVLPGMLLNAPLPVRTEADRARIRTSLLPPDCTWKSSTILGGEGRPIEVWRLQRPMAKGVAILLHGFGDDAWGTAPRLRDLPGWDIAVFTFRGRDHDFSTPSTLGGWEGDDVVAVVKSMEANGHPRHRIVLVGASQGAGVALLALSKLENAGGPLGGALLESPFMTLTDAARNHIRGTVGRWEMLFRLAEKLALLRAGFIAHFRPQDVSPLKASITLKTPIALLTGDSDSITPLSGVVAIARYHPDLTVVHGAGHLQAGAEIQGGWALWAGTKLKRFGF